MNLLSPRFLLSLEISPFDSYTLCLYEKKSIGKNLQIQKLLLSSIVLQVHLFQCYIFLKVNIIISFDILLSFIMGLIMSLSTAVGLELGDL